MKKLVHKKLDNLVIEKDIAERYIELTNKLEEIKKELDPLEKQLKLELLEMLELLNKTDFDSNGIAGKLIGSYTRNSLDTNRLKEEKPEIYKDYLKITNVNSTIKLNIN